MAQDRLGPLDPIGNIQVVTSDVEVAAEDQRDGGIEASLEILPQPPHPLTSHRGSRSSRLRIELTFQVAIFIDASTLQRKAK